MRVGACGLDFDEAEEAEGYADDAEREGEVDAVLEGSLEFELGDDGPWEYEDCLHLATPCTSGLRLTQNVAGEVHRPRDLEDRPTGVEWASLLEFEAPCIAVSFMECPKLT